MVALVAALVVVAQMPLVVLVAKEIMAVQAREPLILMAVEVVDRHLPQVVAQVALAVLVVMELHQVFLVHL
jgi:hypothetical protein